MTHIIGVDRYESFLAHYGIKRKSGRYPWGSGGNTEAARSRDFFGMVDALEKKGLSRKEVAEGLGMTTTEFRDTVTIAKNAIRRENQLRAEKLRDKGMSTSAIGREMGLNESSVRQLLNKQVQERTQILENTVDMLRAEVDKGDGWLDVGSGTEYYIPGGGISKEKLRSAVSILKDEGYVQIDLKVPQAGVANQYTNVKVLCPPGTTKKEAFLSMEKIKTLTKVTEDGGRTYLGLLPPLQVDPSRVKIDYAEDGGSKNDGVVYVRRGVDDINIGGSAYAQVRIDVGGTHYIKGMAMYKDDMPPGVDLLVQSNKKRGTPMMGDKNNTVLKNQSDDADNPFGAVVRRQITALDKNGKEYVTSAMNILQEEGSWDAWSRNLSSQVLSKQSTGLARQQLGVSYAKKKGELDEILALTNPTVRAKLLDSFADSADSDAVTLSAAGMKRSSYHVILPFNSLKDNEIYAPNYNQGERLALIRYPHGGTFEIPELVVNNNNRAAKSAIGRAADAVGINHKVAERLSGADFDGDFVMVVPNDSGAIKSSPALRQLQGFDPQSYKLPADAPRMSARTKQKQMGDVSNLITDMTIMGAPTDEIARAVKHSMVVIDAEKHHLDYKRSAQENGISALKKNYQGRADGGAATLISRATSQERVNKRRDARVNEGGPIDKATGKRRYTETGDVRVIPSTLKNGEVRVRTEPVKQISTKLGETDDARTLLSRNGGTRIEKVYADYSNDMKALANSARKAMVNSPDGVPTSPTAKRVYADAVKQLKADLDIALMNSPRERRAQVLANEILSMKRAERPEMDKAQVKKVKAQALAEARARTGAKKDLVPISDTQWEAIQSGAVSKTMLKRILDNADVERVKELATPRPDRLLDGGATARAKNLLAAGLTQAEVARIMGVSLTTLKRGLE